jgi:hypothetical protein
VTFEAHEHGATRMEAILAMGVSGWAIGLVAASLAALRRQRRREAVRYPPSSERAPLSTAGATSAGVTMRTVRA